jgi:hypothetical protein
MTFEPMTVGHHVTGRASLLTISASCRIWLQTLAIRAVKTRYVSRVFTRANESGLQIESLRRAVHQPSRISGDHDRWRCGDALPIH